MMSDAQNRDNPHEQWWPKVSTAFVVIHGNGPHRPFDALDSFVCGFSKWMSANSKGESTRTTKWRHYLRRRNGWIESYLSGVREPGGEPALDFYEYYWDCFMTRELTVGEAVDWLEQASSGIRAFYWFWEREAELDTTQVKEYWLDPGDRSEDGTRLKHPGHMKLLRFLKVLPLLKLLMRRCWKRTSRYLDNYVGDVVIYTTSDVRSRNYNTRQKVLSEAVDELSSVLRSDSYDQVIVVAHSLGSIIAYDALNRIALDVKTGGGLCEGQASKLKGLVTLGSPLDKTAFYYDNRSFAQQKKRVNGASHLPEPLPQQRILSHLHSFRRISLPVDPKKEIDIEDPIRGFWDNAAWLNFYHPKDLVGDRLYAYRGVKNVQCTKSPKRFWQAHNVYWDWDGMYESIAGEFFK